MYSETQRVRLFPISGATEDCIMSNGDKMYKHTIKKKYGDKHGKTVEHSKVQKFQKITYPETSY